jgi:hypothetical protein
MTNFKIRNIIFLFLLLVVTILSGLLFSVEPFRSSSPNNRGEGIGDSFAASLDLPLNTDNSRLFVIPTNF